MESNVDRLVSNSDSENLVYDALKKTFWKVVKRKSTENYKGAPYITTLLSTSLWTFYGILKPDILVVTVNGAGAIFQLTYVILFLMYAPKDKKIKTAKLVAILNAGFLGVVIAITLLAMHGSLQTTFVGVLCAALTIGMYAAPLSAMKRVIRTRSVQYMPFFLSFFLFLNGGVWSVYAVLVKDYYIGVPNVVGFVLGSAQLILYMIYRNKSAAMIEEKGPVQTEAKGGVEMPARGDNDEEAAGNLKSRSLAEGKTKSLPKPSVERQHSLQKLTKTLSIGNIISLLLFVSPIKTFWGVVKKKSTENYKGVPYTTTLLSTSLWTFYGLIKPDILVVSVNGVGAIFQFIYVTLFLIYAPKHTKVTMAKLVAILNVGFLGVVIAVALLAIHGNLRITFVGILCAALTIGMYAAPLSAMRRVIKTKSVEYMPFLLSFFLFLNGGVWSTYSVLVKDFYIGNKNKSASAKTMKAIEEDGSVHRDKDGEDDGGAEEGNLKNRSLSKGKSLPKPSVNGEYSLQKITKTLSFSANEAGIENGKLDSLDLV
ncbi:hypothetical protein NC651_029647 [Populus alba x Populus x berolinensis]|nr:hypothetical protein NC651_029647 [Populus alba x Populus x berolinensis]